MKSLSLLVSILGLVVLWAACNDSIGPSKVCVSCDTCDTFLPISFLDSVNSTTPLPKYEISNATEIAPNVFVCNAYYKEERKSPWFGVSIYDKNYKRLITYANAYYCTTYDPDLIVLNNYVSGDVSTLRISTGQLHKIANGWYRNMSPSIDGRSVFVDSSWKAYELGIDGTWARSYSSNIMLPIQIDSNTLLGVMKNKGAVEFPGLAIYDIATKQERLVVPKGDLTEVSWGMVNLRPLPDRKQIFIDLARQNWFPQHRWSDLCILDLRDTTITPILKSQYWAPQYRPVVYRGNRFLATYFCRKDSAATIYEYDLYGNALRHVLTKEDTLYPH